MPWVTVRVVNIVSVSTIALGMVLGFYACPITMI